MDHGANGEAKDSAGHAPGKLADKAGRRISKEVIDEHVRRSSKEDMNGGRRNSKELDEATKAQERQRRKSRELMEGKEAAEAAAA